MNLPGYGELFECPYNRAHQVCKSRAQTHLIKCRRNYPDVKKVQCPFNATHLLNEPELNMHVADCPDRASFDRYKYSCDAARPSGATAKREADVAHNVNFNAVESEENWDDLDEPTYDPQQYVQNAPVIRTLNNAKPSERSAFRNDERLRMNELKRSRQN